MNDGMFQAIRNYLEELASQGKQLIAGQERTNELLNEIRLAANRQDDRLKTLAGQADDAQKAAMPSATSTPPAVTPPIPKQAVGPVTVETVKEEPLQTTETVEVKEAPAPKSSRSPSAPPVSGGDRVPSAEKGK